MENQWEKPRVAMGLAVYAPTSDESAADMVRLAAKETEYKNLARADRLYTEFCLNYRRHPSAADMATRMPPTPPSMPT